MQVDNVLLLQIISFCSILISPFNMDSEALNYPIAHPGFVCYPKRWFLEVNQVIKGVESGRFPREELSKVVLEVISVAEHLGSQKMGHFLSILLWSSYCSGRIAFVDCVNHVFVELSELSTCLSDEKSKSDLDDIFLKIRCIKMSCYYSQSPYLQLVVDALLYLSSTSLIQPLEANSLVNWRFGSQIDKMFSVLCQLNELFNQRKYGIILKMLNFYCQSCHNIPALNELVLWNMAVTLDKLGKDVQCTEILELCAETFNGETLMRTVDEDCPSYKGVLQQLIVRNSFSKKDCNSLNSLYADSSYHHEYYITLCQNDVAYISEDFETQLLSLEKLQSFELASILEYESSEMESRKLAICTILLTQSHTYLDKNDLQSGYEYFVLSHNQANDLNSCSKSSWFPVLKSRYLAQLHSLEGYFLVLQGKLEQAAIAYGKSYSYDSHLIMSVYSQTLLLLKLGKALEAKRNWESANLGYRSHQHGQHFSELTDILGTIE